MTWGNDHSVVVQAELRYFQMWPMSHDANKAARGIRW
jgi:hypothetical protein